MDATLKNEKKYEKIGKTVSIILHALLLIFLFLNLLHPPDPPPGQAGILVSFGEPNIGQGEEVSAPPPAAEEEEVEEDTEPEEVVEETIDEPEEVEEPTPAEPSAAEKADAERKKLLEDKASKERALKKKQEQDAQNKADAEAKKKKEAEDAKKRAEDAKKRAEAEKKRKAEEARKAKEAEEARKKAEADKFKGEIGGLFGQDGDGKGNTGTSGNQGDPNGDPNADNLEGISTGSGDIGGNLGGRGVLYKPVIKDKSQKTGDVNLKVCVDESGIVVSAEFTQGGSTTSDSDLIRTAIAGARKYKFEKSSLDKQCGTIKIKFRVK